MRDGILPRGRLERDNGQREHHRCADENCGAANGHRPLLHERTAHEQPGPHRQQQRGGYDDESPAVLFQVGLGMRGQGGEKISPASLTREPPGRCEVTRHETLGTLRLPSGGPPVDLPVTQAHL